MIRFIVALLLIQAFSCAEFPDLEKHIKLVWNNTNLTGQFDGSQTVSDKDGNVANFILCGAFNNSAYNGDCSYNYSYAEQLDSGSIWSASGKFFSSLGRSNSIGKGGSTAKFISKVNDTYSCLAFLNMVGDFKNVYEKTPLKKANWQMSYSCIKDIPEPDLPVPWGLIIGVTVGLLVIVGGIGMCVYKFFKKKKTSGKTNGNDPLLRT